jgi:hypothetical protein
MTQGTAMRNTTSHPSAHTFAAESAFREHARRDAMVWLSSQLRWERTLTDLRSQEERHAQQAA